MAIQSGLSRKKFRLFSGRGHGGHELSHAGRGRWRRLSSGVSRKRNGHQPDQSFGRGSIPRADAPYPSVSVVVPTLNEAGGLAWVLERIPGWVSEVILVDGLSTDHTEAVARDLRSDVIVIHQVRRGKGAALRAGFAAATGEVIVMIDGDGSTNPAEMGRFVEALQRGAEFVKGSRHLRDGGSEDWTRMRRAGNRAFVHIVNFIYGCEFTDLCYGYCAFWRKHLPALALTADGFEIETQLVLNAVKAGLHIREIPSIELPRRAGVSNLHAYRDGRRVLQTIMDERPGRDSRRRARRTGVQLVRAEVAAPGSTAWMPAGRDRRRKDRRVLDREASGYTGPERRRGDRRRPPSSVAVVYRAIEAETPPRVPEPYDPVGLRPAVHGIPAPTTAGG
jgi:hypothetical protein